MLYQNEIHQMNYAELKIWRTLLRKVFIACVGLLPIKLIRTILKLKKDLEHMIYGVLASYLKQLTGEPWVLFKDKVLLKSSKVSQDHDFVILAELQMAWWWWFYMSPRLSSLWSSWSTASHYCDGCRRWSQRRKWMSSSGFQLAWSCFNFVKLYWRREKVRTFDITLCSRWAETWNCETGIYLWFYIILFIK